MKKKNGFISTAVVFSFLITFLLIISIILGSYVNSRIRLTKYKNELKYQDLDARY